MIAEVISQLEKIIRRRYIISFFKHIVVHQTSQSINSAITTTHSIDLPAQPIHTFIDLLFFPCGYSIQRFELKTRPYVYNIIPPIFIYH